MAEVNENNHLIPSVLSADVSNLFSFIPRVLASCDPTYLLRIPPIAKYGTYCLGTYRYDVWNYLYDPTGGEVLTHLIFPTRLFVRHRLSHLCARHNEQVCGSFIFRFHLITRTLRLTGSA